MRWGTDKSVELNVMGAEAREVESVARGLASELAPSGVTAGKVPELAPDSRERLGQIAKGMGICHRSRDHSWRYRRSARTSHPLTVSLGTGLSCFADHSTRLVTH